MEKRIIKEYWDAIEHCDLIFTEKTFEDDIQELQTWLERKEERSGECPISHISHFIQPGAGCDVCNKKWSFIQDSGILKFYEEDDDIESNLVHVCPCAYLEATNNKQLIKKDDDLVILKKAHITADEIIQFVIELLVEGVRRQIRRENRGV